MKLVNKKSVFFFLTAFAVFELSAQTIELPEVTTVISGETDKAGEDALPDFSDVLKIPAGSGGVEPVLPEVETSENTDIAAGKSKPVEKSVYAEGLIGGGYPAGGYFENAKPNGHEHFLLIVFTYLCIGLLKYL